VWLQVGNASTGPIAELLRERAARLRSFEEDQESAFLIISLGRRAI
jgi:hypothetical protein